MFRRQLVSVAKMTARPSSAAVAATQRRSMFGFNEPDTAPAPLPPGSPSPFAEADNYQRPKRSYARLLPKSKRPMNEAARQQLATRLEEEEARQAQIAARQEALVAKQENGDAVAGASLDDPVGADGDVLEPALSDLDISIPLVDCPFVAELVARRLDARDRMHLKGRDDSDTAAPKSDLKEGETVETFRASVKDDEVPAAAEDKGLATTSDSLETEGGKKKQSDSDADAEPEPEPWRDEYEDGFTLIDVRTIGEVSSWGMIEGAKLLPAHEMWEALTETDGDAFFERYGFEKPQRNHGTMLIYCQYGPRALMAAQIAVYLGYENVVVLRDGYYEWAKQYKKLIRRHHLADLENGFDEARREEFRLARGIGRDIAPEFNDYVDAEVETLKIETGRSRGKRIVPFPPAAERLLLEVREAQEQEGKLLNDPSYRRAVIQRYDSEYESGHDGLVELDVRTGPGKEDVLGPSEVEQKVLDKIDENASIASRLANAAGVPVSPNLKERAEENIGQRLLLASKRKREQRLSEKERKVNSDLAELRAKKRYPHKASWRTI